MKRDKFDCDVLDAHSVFEPYAEGMDFSGSDDDAGSEFDPSATIIDWEGDPCEDSRLAKVLAIAELESLHQRLAAIESQIRRSSRNGRKSPWHRVRVGHRTSLLAQISAQQDRVDAM